MSSGRYPRGLPPQCPSTPRRGSNSPISPIAVNSTSSVPNRSRSLDGLLDTEPIQIATAATNSEQTPSENAQKSQSCDNNLDKKISDENIHIDKETEKLNDRNSSLSNASSRTQNLENSLDDSLDSNDINKSSDLSLHSNSSDTSKQKRKFVNRCVNKVRSLIKK